MGGCTAAEAMRVWPGVHWVGWHTHAVVPVSTLDTPKAADWALEGFGGLWKALEGLEGLEGWEGLGGLWRRDYSMETRAAVRARPTFLLLVPALPIVVCVMTAKIQASTNEVAP